MILGAEYDVRAYVSFRRDGLAFFEVDQPSVKLHKRVALDEADIFSEHVTFFSVDFANENVLDKLI